MGDIASDQKEKAFFDDLMAICVHHGAHLMGQDDGSCLIVENKDTRFDEYTIVGGRLSDGCVVFVFKGEHEAQSPFTPFPTTAHGRFTAAARVDAIRAELAPPAATAHIECGWCCAEDLEIECCPSCGKGGYVAAAIKTPKPKEASNG